MSIDQLTAEAPALSSGERETLAYTLLECVDGQEEPDLDPESPHEILRRIEEMESGKAAGIPREEVRAKMRREIECD